MKYINRHLEKAVRHLSSEFPCILVTGARQTGKTTLLKQITSPSSVSYLSFDDQQEELSANTDPKMFMSLHPYPVFFDEIQYVPSLFRYMKMQIDSDRHNGMYYLTGSQQFTLMEKISESLSGRIGILQLYPLSKREITESSFDLPFIPCEDYILKRSNSVKVTGTSIWESIFLGGYPAVISKEVSPSDFYSNYIKTYIERDIRNITQITDELQFLRFLTVVASRTGQLINYSDISKDVGVSEVTVKKWLSLLVSSGLVYLLQPFSTNVEKRVVKTPKLYFTDTGLAAYLTKWTSPEVIQSGAMSGAFFETYAVSEIVKSFTNIGTEPPLYFYRDKDKCEIDLIIYINDTVYPVEIKKTATPTTSDAKNLQITDRIKNIKIAKGTVLCNCTSPVSIKQNVFAVPIDYI